MPEAGPHAAGGDDAAYHALVDDLAEEQGALDGALVPTVLDTPTVAAGWSVGDTVAHLHTTDRSALLAIRDPGAFAERRAARAAGQTPANAGDELPTGAALLAAWRRTREELVAAFRSLAGATRIEWYGPSMSARSFASARIMEYWAHGEDVALALGVDLAPTDRLRHVCHLGVITRDFSLRSHGLPPDPTPVLVELDAPSGAAWRWGEPEATSSVRGWARDFCLVVTQRRHLADTDLLVEGDAALRWLEVAQAFAGVGTTTDERRRGLPTVAVGGT